MNEPLQRNLLNPIPRNSKLRAADTTQRRGNRGAGVHFLPDMPPNVNLLGLVEEVKVAAGTVHVDPVGATGVVMAADVHVAHAGDAVVV